MKRSKFITAAGTTLATINVVSAPARAAQFVYKMGDPDPIDFPPDVRLAQMINAVKTESNGRMEIQLFPGSVLGSTTSMMSQMRLGSLQFTRAVNANYSGVVPIAGIDSVGFAFTNAQQPYGALDGALGEYIRKEFTAKNIHAFERCFDTGFRQVTSSTKPIKTADDFAGFKLRTPNAPIFVDLFKTLGASPIPLDSSELYTALQTHIVSGQEGSYQAVESHKLFEVQKYMSITNHIWGGSWLLCNLDAWNALPSDIQAIVTRNVNKYAVLERNDVKVSSNAFADKLKREGMAFNTPDISSMRAHLGPFYTKWKREFGPVAWSLLEEKSGKLG